MKTSTSAKFRNCQLICLNNSEKKIFWGNGVLENPNNFKKGFQNRRKKGNFLVDRVSLISKSGEWFSGPFFWLSFGCKRRRRWRSQRKCFDIFLASELNFGIAAFIVFKSQGGWFFNRLWQAQSFKGVRGGRAGGAGEANYLLTQPSRVRFPTTPKLSTLVELKTR